MKKGAVFIPTWEQNKALTVLAKPHKVESFELIICFVQCRLLYGVFFKYNYVFHDEAASVVSALCF